MKKTKKFISILAAFSLMFPASAVSGNLSVNTSYAADQFGSGTSGGCNYEFWNQDYEGTISMTKPGNYGSFSCSWDGVKNCMFICGKSLGSIHNYKDYYGGLYFQYALDFQPCGDAIFGYYGWTENPTVEYYIVEGYGERKPFWNTEKKGTFSSDGKTYDIYQKKIINQPSIHGTETYDQYWSVIRDNPAQVNRMNNISGTVCISNHFKEWESLGMETGNIYNIMFSIEATGSKGNANVRKTGFGYIPDEKPVVVPPEYSEKAYSLKDYFADYFKVGAAVKPEELIDAKKIITSQFNSITPANELKPDSLLSPGTDNLRANVSLKNADATLKFCQDNGIPLRGHTFVWYSQTPDWFFRENFSSSGDYVSKEVMNKRLENFIKDTFELLASEYPKLEVYAYDICNELFVNDGGGFRPQNNSKWTTIYGDSDEFVINAFKYARMYAPEGCKLFLADYNEYFPEKTNDIFNMAVKLKQLGIIDGISMQSHLATNYPDVNVYEKALEKFISSGLEIQITELDIMCDKDLNFDKQSELYRKIFQTAAEHSEQISSVTLSGINGNSCERCGAPHLLFDVDYKPRQPYYAIMNLNNSDASGNGDIDGNGTVNIIDAVTLIEYLISADELTAEQIKSADMNGDGTVSVLDVILMKSRLM